jgi:hypothetical protein
MRVTYGVRLAVQGKGDMGSLCSTVYRRTEYPLAGVNGGSHSASMVRIGAVMPCVSSGRDKGGPTNDRNHSRSQRSSPHRPRTFSRSHKPPLKSSLTDDRQV